MNKTFIAIVALVTAGLLYLLAPILTPFLVGALLAYLVNPIVKKLMSLRLPRLFAVIVVFLVLILVITLLIVMLIPLIQTQIANLTDFIPSVINWLQNTIVPWFNHLGLQETINIDTVKSTLTQNWSKAESVATWIVKTILHSGFAFVALITNLILIPVVTFYLLRDWDKVLAGLRGLLPRRIEPAVIKVVMECNDVLSAFFRGQLLVMLSLGVIYSIGLSLIGLRIGIMIGLLVGLASIVPYLGLIIGIMIASIAAYIQFGTWESVSLVLLVFAIGQLSESMFLTPKLVGHRIGLHPVAVIFAVLTGGMLFGFFGVLLALPVAAIIMVMLRFVNQRYQSSRLYK